MSRWILAASAWIVASTSSTSFAGSEPKLEDLLDLSLPQARVSALVQQLLSRRQRLRQVASTLNTRGMRFYKKKDWSSAAQAFELAYQTDAKAALPVWNRACVAGLLVDATGAVGWL